MMWRVYFVLVLVALVSIFGAYSEITLREEYQHESHMIFLRGDRGVVTVVRVYTAEASGCYSVVLEAEDGRRHSVYFDHAPHVLEGERWLVVVERGVMRFDQRVAPSAAARKE